MALVTTRRSTGHTLRAVAVAVVATIGLGATALGAGAATAPDGYTTTPITSAGLSLAVPDGWLKVDPTSADSAAALQQAANANPNLAGLMTQYEQIKDSIKYWIINSEPAAFADNLLVLPIPVPASMLAKPSAVKQVLQNSLGSSVDSLTVTKTKVDKKPALEARATLAVTGADGSATTAHATIILVKTKRGVIDLDYTSATPPDSDPTWKAIRASIDLT